MRRRWLLVVVGWLATAALATVIGLGAIRLVGESLTGTPGGVRGEDEIARALASAPPALARSGAPSTSSPSAPSAGDSPVRRTFTTGGGSAVAECVPEGVRLVSWAPAQGFRVRDVDRGPDDDVEVSFEGGAGEYELKVRCLGREPVAVEDD
ncbi:septum formation initiator [Micromonospora sp. NPDC005367]|uniref:septum formation initiator n=1 Tax=Micromonospora sp. NPDC005367 TaxID=3155590 RepID=UPI0033AE60FB